MKYVLMIAALVASLASAAQAQVPLDGYFIALADCAANKKKDSDNPGNVRLEPLRAYRVIGRNATPGTHYQVRVPGVPVTDARWVAMACGAFAPQDSLVMSGAMPPPSDGGPAGSSGSGLAPDSIEHVLAASWQPGFCATAAGANKIECRTQTADRPDARQFSIHGLWPDDLHDQAIFPCYCDRGEPVSCRGSQAPDATIALPDDVFERLAVAMPGVQSGLHRHQWAKHGSCYEDDKTGDDAGADPAEYYRETMALLDQLNASAVRDLFVDHRGEELTRAEIEAAFDAAFGEGAGDRVVVRCDRRTGVITELRISLAGNIDDAPDLAALIQAAPESGQGSCARGLVVKVAD